MLQSRLSHQAFDSKPTEKEQWAAIYKHRAQELQRARSLEKLESQQKKRAIKQHLDELITFKSISGQVEKQQDAKYYEYIVQKGKEAKEKQEREKFQKYLKRKKIQEQNQKKFQEALNYKYKPEQKIDTMEIGLKSQIEKRRREQQIRQEVVSSLDRQRQFKEQERQRIHRQQKEQFYKNEAYQIEQFQNRFKHKKYEQNQAVYNYYRDIYNQKMRRDKQIQRMFVDQAQQKKTQDLLKKQQGDILEKEIKNLQMKDTLSRQLKLLNYRKNQQKSFNPEQNSYSFISGVFRERKAPFDKKQYALFLQKQVEEQRLAKLQHRYMNQDEYKYNSNQLNKALSGNYTYDKYHDRSINTLGDRVKANKVDPLKGDDANLIREKLQSLRNTKNRSLSYSRSSNDDIFS